jgi:hypothetical protein
MHDLVDAPSRHLEILGEPVLRELQRFEELPPLTVALSSGPGSGPAARVGHARWRGHERVCPAHQRGTRRRCRHLTSEENRHDCDLARPRVWSPTL